MKPEQQRIAIAEACGWQTQPDANGCYRRLTDGLTQEHLPDYLNDLNACHNFIRVLDYEQADEFDDHLCDICKRVNSRSENPVPWRFAVANATAAQRCKAFLKVMGLWENQ